MLAWSSASEDDKPIKSTTKAKGKKAAEPKETAAEKKKKAKAKKEEYVLLTRLQGTAGARLDSLTISLPVSCRSQR
jgi:hypothetical protein